MRFDYFVEEIPWLWRYRHVASASAEYTLEDLTALDLRLDALFEALFFHRKDALEWCEANIDGTDTGWVAMYACLLGYGGHNLKLIELARLALGCQTLGAYIDGLKWLPQDYLRPVVGYLIHNDEAVLQGIGYQLADVEIEIDTHIIGSALVAKEEQLVLGALRYIVCKRNAYFEPVLLARIPGWDGERYYQALKALLLMGNAGFAQNMIKTRHWRESDHSLMVMLSHALPEFMSSFLNHQMFSSVLTAAWLEALGVLGNPASIPRIIAFFDQYPAESLLAIQAITGVDLRGLGSEKTLDRSGETETEETGINLDLDDVVRWWEGNRGRLMTCSRWFWGVPYSESALMEGLYSGNQRQRGSAALLLALNNKNYPVLDVRAHGVDQKTLLASLEGQLENSVRLRGNA